MKTQYLHSFFVAFITMFTATCLHGQAPQFSQFYANQMYLNPAFTANSYKNRVVTAYRNQWSGVPNAYVSNTLSYERRLYSYNSGIGIMLVRDDAGKAGLKYNNFNLNYSYQVLINPKMGLRFGARYGLVTRKINGNEITFADELLQKKNASLDDFGVVRLRNHDFSGGVVLLTKKLWLGIAADHLNRPDIAFTAVPTRLPIKFSSHAGYEILAKEDKIKKTNFYSLTAVIHYKAQQKWDQLDAGFYFNRFPFYFGFWYRGLPIKSYQKTYPNNESIIAMFGFLTSGFRIAYSYDYTISWLAGATRGAHEITIVTEWPTPSSKRNNVRKATPCPKFMGVEF